MQRGVESKESCRQRGEGARGELKGRREASVRMQKGQRGMQRAVK